ncbi:hypothetical protein BH24ACT5_BH24ACT5_28450 [soil metagenome]
MPVALPRYLAGAALGLIALVGTGGVAHADPPGPTDYLSEVLSIEPATPSIRVDIVGGDSFVELSVEPGTEVIVFGYQAEPYLRFRADGGVDENRRSPTTYLNVTRFGTATAPATADPAAEPEWVAVGSDGRYAWHDHRAHWMSTSPPPATARGDRVAEGVIPLAVDGTDVSVSIASVWQQAPSRAPVTAGAVAAGFCVLIVWSSRRRTAWALAVIAGAGAGVGAWQYLSLPAETGPSPMWWALPAVAGVCSLLALVLGRNLVSAGLVLLAGLELAVWTLLRRDAMFRAVLPTNAPFWLDRGVTAAAGVAAAVGIVVGVFTILARQHERT